MCQLLYILHLVWSLLVHLLVSPWMALLHQSPISSRLICLFILVFKKEQPVIFCTNKGETVKEMAHHAYCNICWLWQMWFPRRGKKESMDWYDECMGCLGTCESTLEAHFLCASIVMIRCVAAEICALISHTPILALSFKKFYDQILTLYIVCSGDDRSSLLMIGISYSS